MTPALEDVLHLWVVNGSGLDSDKVIWARQEGPRPTDTWISLSVISDSQVGQNYSGLREDTPALIEEVVFSNTLTMLSIQCFNGEATGERTPEQILADVRLSYGLPSLRIPFSDVKAAITEFTPIVTVGNTISHSRFERRAVMTAKMLGASELRVAQVEYIEIVEIERGL